MKKLYILLFLGSIQLYGQGLILSNTEEKNKFPRFQSEKFGFSESLPRSYSLEKYVPPVREQDGGTCVGFASFYYALSTMYNTKFDITDPREKYVHSFDPYFIYSIYYNGSNDCDRGLPFGEAFDNLEKLGAKKLFFPPFTDCETSWTNSEIQNTLAYTRPYSIESWFFIDKENLSTSKLISLSKDLISNDIPIITGFKFVKSLYPYSYSNQIGVKSDGLWSPKSYESEEGGHALCVIGYDDYKFGGAFKIVNSWGKEYGDNGYLWIKYEDFVEFAELLFVLELNENIKRLPPTVIEANNYKRYEFRNNRNSYDSYEGQYLYDGVNGYGIWSDKENETYYIGKYTNGDMNGFFLIVDNDGIFSANAVNGDLKNIEKLGFASDQNLINTQKEARDYFLRLGENLSIRKANSSRKNKIKTKE